MTLPRFALVVALTTAAALGAVVLREHHYAQALWLLLATFVVCIILLWRPISVREFCGYAMGEVIGTAVARLVGGLLRLLFH